MTEAQEKVEGFALPHQFGRYILFDRIGHGGMAEIYLARSGTNVGIARLAVVKLILPKFANDPSFEQMLISEAKLAAKLSHGNVVQTLDLGREGGRLYIAMEYVEGYDLNQLLKKLAKKQLPLPAEYGFFMVMEMLRALDYAHRRRDDEGNPLGVVHRDVSPSNVLVSLEGEVKLCDFGIARAMRETQELPAGALEGKAAYMSPEQARSEPVDERADVFSATVVLWEMIAGRRMYRAQPGKEVLELALECAPVPLPDRGLPDQPHLEAIIRKGLSADRDARYPTAAALLRDLEGYVIKSRFMASPMKFGTFLTEHFAEEIVERRQAREQAATTMAQRLDEELSGPRPLPSEPGARPAPAPESGVSPAGDRPRPGRPRHATPFQAPPEAPAQSGVRVWVLLLAIALLGGTLGLWALLR